MRQVLINLFKNALEAMPRGGELTIATRVKGPDLEISVTDTGEGMAPEVAANIFQPYYTTKEKGTGLGLAICQFIVKEQHGGCLQAESTPGKGSTFTIRLPLTEARAGMTPAAAAPLLQVRDLLVHFATPAGARAGRGRGELRLAARRNPGTGGGVGLRQDRHRALHLAPAPRHPRGRERGDPLRRGRPAEPSRTTDMRQIRGNRIAMVFQEPMTALNPVFTIGDQVAEGLAPAPGPGASGRLERGGPGPGPGGPARRPAPLEAVPPPALRGLAPAGHDRHGPGLRAGAA